MGSRIAEMRKLESRLEKQNANTSRKIRNLYGEAAKLDEEQDEGKKRKALKRLQAKMYPLLRLRNVRRSTLEKINAEIETLERKRERLA